MKFESFKNESIHNRLQDENLGRASEREWFLGDLLVRVAVRAHYQDSPPNISLICTWRKQPGSMWQHGRYRRDDGYFEYEHRSFEVLTAEQLKRVAACRAIVEDWVAGVIATLPDDLEGSSDLIVPTP